MIFKHYSLLAKALIFIHYSLFTIAYHVHFFVYVYPTKNDCKNDN